MKAGADITTELEVARNLVLAMPDAAVLLDEGLQLVAYNPRYQEMAGLRHRILESQLANGAGAFDIVYTADRDDAETAMRCLMGGRPIHLAEVSLFNAAGTEMTAYVSFIPVVGIGERSSGVIQVLRDVSDVARVQTRYRELLEMARLRAENLEREVEKRTQELSAALEQVTRLSREDPLTGLLNRRSFSEMADHALKVADRHGRTVALMICDLDHFKRINDTLGHQIGDAVLKASSAALQDAVRTTDIVGRFGGEEFVVLLSETEPEAVTVAAERCRIAVKSAPPAGDGDQQVTPTVSIGVAIFPNHGRTLDELVHNADSALYQSKHAGRDRVMVFDPKAPEVTGPSAMTTSRLRALVIADDPAAVIDTSQLASDFEIVIESDVAAALQRCERESFDVVLADFASTDRGVETLRAVLRLRSEALRVLVLPSEEAFVEVRGSTLARVDCFLLHSEPPERVIDAVRHALTRREVDRQRLMMAHEDVGRLFSGRLIELDKLIAGDKLRFAYQPIVDARTGAIRAYEALCRADHPIFRDATVLFEAALQSGNLWRLGRLCRKTAVRRLPDLSADQHLFINLHPAELDDPNLLAGELERVSAERVVLEITERAAIPDFKRFRATTHALTASGYRLAIDDLGAGYASLSAVALIEPAFVKLDMSMIRGLHRSHHKASLVRRMVEFANDVGIEIVAEGVETEEEARAVGEAGCHLVQGYYYGPPK